MEILFYILVFILLIGNIVELRFYREVRHGADTAKKIYKQSGPRLADSYLRDNSWLCYRFIFKVIELGIIVIGIFSSQWILFAAALTIKAVFTLFKSVRAFPSPLLYSSLYLLILLNKLIYHISIPSIISEWF